MSIWRKIAEVLSMLAKGEGLAAVLGGARTPPERSVAFAIAVIALGAKMAKADGRVTRDEVAAFREVFTIPPGEERNAARVFNMARTDVAGFEGYAQRVARMFADDRRVLEDLLHGLFHVAAADGVYHPGEDAYLRRVAEIFGIDERSFNRMLMLDASNGRMNPYALLGVAPDATDAEVAGARRALVRENHPDRMIARGVPPEAVRLATDRLAAINTAYERIIKERRPVSAPAEAGAGG